MFRIWIKVFKENRMIRDMVVEKPEFDLSRTKKVLSSLDYACHEWDLAVPIWLESTISDFKRHSKARFYSDSFTESIDFDYLEMQVIEE